MYENTCQHCRYFSGNCNDDTMGDHCCNKSSYSYGRQVRIPQKERCGNFAPDEIEVKSA